MFSLDPIHPIYSAIVELVAVRPGMTIGELAAQLQKNMKIKISLAHVYRIVTRMLDTQVLIKVHGTLSLNLMWVSYIEFVASRAKRIIQHTDDFPLKQGEKRTYDAKSLFDVEAIWNHILVSLYRETKEMKLHKYYSHAWWQLGRSAEEITFYKQLKQHGIDCHWLFGSDTFLDRVGAKRVNEVFRAITTNRPPFPKNGYNLSIYGDTIIECILPEKIDKHFQFFFDHVKTMKQFDDELFIDIFSMRASYKVTVWRNAKQAQILRQNIMKCTETA